MAARFDGFFAGVALVGALAALAVAEPPSPGTATLCAPGYARSHRLAPERYYPVAREAYRRAGIPWSTRENHRLDHRLPICLGGGWEQSNLRVQTIAAAAEKDRLEWKACREVCDGKISVETARAWFADWRRAYRQQFTEDP